MLKDASNERFPTRTASPDDYLLRDTERQSTFSLDYPQPEEPIITEEELGGWYGYAFAVPFP